MTCSHKLRRVAPAGVPLLLFILSTLFINQLLAKFLHQFFADTRSCNNPQVAIDSKMAEQPENSEPVVEAVASTSAASAVDLDSVYQRNPALVEPPMPAAVGTDLESPDLGLIVKATAGNGLDFKFLAPMPLVLVVKWIRNEVDLKFPFDYMWEKIVDGGMQMAYHTQEEIEMYKDILLTKRSILVNTYNEANDLREIIKLTEEIAKAESWIEMFRSGACLPVEATLHRRFVTAYPERYDVRLSMLFVNHEIYVKQLAKPYWIQKIVSGNRGLFKDSTGVWRKFIFDSNYNYCRFVTRLTCRPPTLEDGLASPNANQASLLYDFESEACSLWPRSHCSKWSGTPDLEDGEPVKHGYSTCHACRCLRCRDVCIRERVEADEDEEWKSDSSPKEPSLTLARRCECSKCTRLVLQDEYEVETIESALTETSSESYDASQAYHLVGALQPTLPPIPDPESAQGNTATDELYENVSFPRRPRAATPVEAEPLRPDDDLQRNVRADAIRLYGDMDYFRYMYDILADPIGNLITAARIPDFVTNETRRYPHLFQRLVEAAEEAGVRREDDDAADEAGVRETLYTLLLDHAHHARDRRWGEPGDSRRECPMCAQGATHLDPHVPGGGRDPEQVVRAPSPPRDDTTAVSDAELAQIFQYRTSDEEEEVASDDDHGDADPEEDEATDSDVSAPE